MLVVIGRAAASLKANAGLYGALVLGAIALQALAYHVWRTEATMSASVLIVTALLSSIVYAQTQGDIDGAEPGAVWARALERAWAVIVITLAQTFIIGAGYGSIVAGDIVDRLLGVAVLMMGLTFIFADIDAVTNDTAGWLLLIPRAFSSSIRACWTGGTMIRVIGLFLAQLLVEESTLGLRTWLQTLHISDAAFWASTPLETLAVVPFGIVTLYVYFDAIGYESKRPCGE